MGTSDEIVTGSDPSGTRGEEQTPDTEVKEREGGKVGSYEAPRDSLIGRESGVGTAMSPHEQGESGTSAGQTSSPKKPNLSREQQEWLNKVFIPSFRKELLRQVQFDRRLLEQHRRELERRKIEEEGHKKALRAADEEKEKLLQTVSDLKIDKALVSCAAANNAINPDQVRILLKSRVKLGEDLEPMVLDEKGERQLNQDGEFMTVEEGVRAFLAENPHLLKPGPARSGSGSTGSARAGRGFAIGPTSSGELIAEGLIEESRKPPTRTVTQLEEQ